MSLLLLLQSANYKGEIASDLKVYLQSPKSMNLDGRSGSDNRHHLAVTGAAHGFFADNRKSQQVGMVPRQIFLAYDLADEIIFERTAKLADLGGGFFNGCRFDILVMSAQGLLNNDGAFGLLGKGRAARGQSAAQGKRKRQWFECFFDDASPFATG